MELFEKVEGSKDDHKVKLYALSTCPWCKKTKKLLESLDVQYYYIDLDTATEEKKNEVRDELLELNPSGNVPTIIIDEGDEIIVGFKEEKIKEILED
ncbi:MAG: glutaredoxin family protein [Hadesarchaea archaeon]|nr:glutaredoxin family protein [Hadesarchaea archaeon]